MSSYRCSILIVDDEPAIRNLLFELLSLDFEALTAPSAEAAREVLAHRSVDIILTDQQLPGQSGVPVARMKHPMLAAIPMQMVFTGDRMNCIVS